MLLLIQTICYILAKILTASREKYRLNTPLDEKIPFLPWTGLIYISAFVFWVIGFGAAVAFPGFYRMAAAQILCCLICGVTFVVFPTRMASPQPPPGIKGAVVRLIYLFDTPQVNLFPSMHSTASWLCFLVALGAAPRWWQVISLVWAVLILLSTLTVKQHDIADVITGVALAHVCWLVCGLVPVLPRLAQTLLGWVWRLAGIG